MKHYYAFFKKTSEAIEVEFPDLLGCVTFGSSFEEAYDNAVDVLAAWLANAETQFIKGPSSYEVLLPRLKTGMLIPIPIDEKIYESYQKLKRINIILPIDILKEIDSFRKKSGLKRSTFLLKASKEYLKSHAPQHPKTRKPKQPLRNGGRG